MEARTTIHCHHRARGRRLRCTLPGINIASQAKTVEEARDNLAEALALFCETADPSEIASPLYG